MCASEVIRAQFCECCLVVRNHDANKPEYANFTLEDNKKMCTDTDELVRRFQAQVELIAKGCSVKIAKTLETDKLDAYGRSY